MSERARTYGGLSASRLAAMASMAALHEAECDGPDLVLDGVIYRDIYASGDDWALLACVAPRAILDLLTAVGEAPPPAASYECGCPSCRISRATAEIEAAQSAWIEESAHTHMNLAHAIDELSEVTAKRRPISRRRLSRLLEAIRWQS